MTVSVEMFFDPAGDAAVRGLWDRLEAAGLRSLATTTHHEHHPHVTLTVAERITVNDAARRVLAGLLGTELDLPVLGAFPGERSVLFLGATRTPALAAAQRDLYTALGDAIAGAWELYLPEHWVPHCTLAMALDTGELQRAFGALHPHPARTLRVARINLVDVGTGALTPVV
ncbi:2'-5' RNA ligase family protein [Actinospica durhamensis]|uniref:2'-5' RNA ligase family protein n=1 Tax=Actinospica durhamensis TaxID=1508375 RepID=A0A941IMY7_9ACTN|nr:2'-5' RNA ligase family protein [Actinospica durhamensis]MBR7834765.1 2'-5' RNA ligase family protein [Actinospica durhamensis]